MHRNSLLENLNNYKTHYPSENSVTEKFIEFVKNNENCFNRSLLVGHVTGSDWVLNQAKTKVLLTHHRKLNKWLQLGGHADGNPDILDVAVGEESGLSEFQFIDKNIFDIDIHPIPAHKNEPEHFHYDVRFLFICNGSEEYSVSDESHDLSWIDLNRIEEYTSSESILKMKNKTINIIP